MNSKKHIQSVYDFSFNTLYDYITEIGQPAYRVEQIWRGLYLNFFSDWDEFTTLPKQLRNTLKENLNFHNLIPVKTIFSSDNSTEKTLFNLPSGNPVETVLMHDRKRTTICVSIQSGCGMGCTFCATGRLGLLMNLSAGEIIEQIIHFSRELKSRGESISNIVFMGMGEPFNNYDSLINSIKTLKDEKGMKIGSRRITVSTIGVIPFISKFAKDESQVNLAISLHAPNNALRSTLVPLNTRYPIDELIAECKNYTQKTHRRISFEYVMIDGLNNTNQHAQQLSKLMQGMLCHINLISFNPIENSSYKSPSWNSMVSFCQILINNGIPATIRKSMGIEINASCGQLAGQYKT